MGYTHYLRRKPELPRAEFRSAVADCKVLLARLQAAGLRLAWEDDQPDKPPRLTLAGIRFNGTGPAEEDLGHETFLVDRVHRPYRDHTGKVYQTPDKNGYFTFCKTAQKPYDLAVCGCLVILSHHLGDAVQIGSDGDDDEENWPKARELCQELFGYGWDFSVESPPERLTPKGLLAVEDVTDRETGKPTRWGFRRDVGMKELANGWVLVTRYAPDRLAWHSLSYAPPLRDVGANDPTARYGSSLRKVSLYPGQWDAKDGRDALGHYDSLPEAVREATKLDVWATCYRLPGADLFLPGVLNDKNGFPGPHALNLLVWADWRAERAVVREYALAERHLRALAPLPARRRRAEPEPEALACH